MDDTILLGSASTQIARCFKITLDLFLNVFGSQINVNKSWLYGSNNSPNSLRELTNIIGIWVNLQCTSFIYLGVPIINKKSTIAIWRHLIQKMKKKIQLWSNSWLNLAGKVVLINSILSSYPIFSCAIFAAPKEVIRSFNMEITNFLWPGGKTQGINFNLVKW